MRPAYTIQATDDYDDDDRAEGTTTGLSAYVDENHNLIVEDVRRLPELGPRRTFRNLKFPVVLPIGNRRFKVSIDRAYSDEWEWDSGVPAAGKVTFEETDEPETEHTVWDAKAEAEAELNYLATRPVNDERDRSIYEIGQQIAIGSLNHFSPNRDHALGQPVFVQSKSFPCLNGKAAYHLFTIDSNWGDCGNENYMVALDDDGYPVAVFYEASCC